MNKKRSSLKPVLATTLVLVFTICGARNSDAQPTNPGSGAVSPAVRRLENGIYSVLGEAPARQDVRAEGVPQVVLAYDRRKYSDAPPSEPLAYVAIDLRDYVPLAIAGTPEMKSDERGKSVLTVSLTRKNAERAEAFSRAHLGGRIAIVVDGEIVTLHKVRSVITGGRVQITRCTDNACEVIRAKLVK